MGSGKCMNGDCARYASDGMSAPCCEWCAGDRLHDRHTPDCNMREHPDSPGAMYYNDPEAGAKLVDRLQRALAMTEALKREYNIIRRVAHTMMPGYSGTMEALTAHLEVDLQYMGAELKRMLR